MNRDIKEMKKFFHNKGYNLLSTEYKNNKLPLIFEKDGYVYSNTYNGFIKTDNYKKWGKNNPYSIQNLKKYIKEDGATCEILSEKYDYDNITLKCECGEIYSISTHNLINQKQYHCPKCGRQQSAKKHRLDEKYLSYFKDYDLELYEEYKGCKYHHWVRTKEGYVTKASAYSLSKGINPNDFIFNVKNRYALNNINLWLSLNGKGLKMLSKQYKGAKEKYIFKCSCGENFEASWEYIYLSRVTRCPKCNSKISNIELKTKEWLDFNNIKYYREKTFKDCRYKRLLRFDFYLIDLNKVIEVDGIQHYQPTNFGNIDIKTSIDNFKQNQIKDKIKDNYCKSHNIPILRIPYTCFEDNTYKKMLSTFTAKI